MSIDFVMSIVWALRDSQATASIRAGSECSSSEDSFMIPTKPSLAISGVVFKMSATFLEARSSGKSVSKRSTPASRPMIIVMRSLVPLRPRRPSFY